MIPHGLTPIAAAIVIAAFMLADRFAGADWLQDAKTKWPWLHGRPVYFATVFLAAVLAVIHWPLLIFAAAWFVWREPAWGVLGGSIDPIKAAEVRGTFLRHLLSAGLIVAALVVGAPWWSGIAATLIFALWATLLGMWNGSQSKKGHDVNWIVETVRCSVYGALVCAMIGASA